MRRPTALILAPLVACALLAGCGGGDGSKSTAEEATSKAAVKELPKVTGGFGDKPKVTADPKVKPPAETTSKVLVAGKGPKVAKGDLLVVDYLGQIYATNKVFDNSYDRKQPTAFPIGTNKVIIGWDKSLVGLRAGSRVLIVVPPDEGYGSQGNEQAGIKPTDTLVFVVDVIASYGKDGPRQASIPVTRVPPGLPKVSGPPTGRPTVTVPKSTPPPKKPSVTMLSVGTGPTVEAGKLAVIHFEATSWGGEPVFSSWESGAPQAVPLGATGTPNPFDVLIGKPVGSRALVLLPPQEGGDPKKDSVAVVADIIAQHGPAKEES